MLWEKGLSEQNSFLCITVRSFKIQSWKMEYIKIMSYFVSWPQIIELSKNLYLFSAKLNKLLDYIKNTELYSFLNDKLRSFQIFVSSPFKQNI